MQLTAFLLLIIIALWAWYFFSGVKKPAAVSSFKIDENFLQKNILFYAKLNPEQQVQFRADMTDFLTVTRFTGAETAVTDADKMLVAAGAIIPVFHFPRWQYRNLKEVIIYPENFNHGFEISGNKDRNILGMVGSGYMEGTMILSRHAIEQSFLNKTDKHNTVIHEFVHLVDKTDGETDGIPQVLMEQPYVLPWLDMIQQEMQKIKAGHSDIDPYAYTSKTEFFAVVAEYFFERPDLLSTKHPKLYEMMEEMFVKES